MRRESASAGQERQIDLYVRISVGRWRVVLAADWHSPAGRVVRRAGSSSRRSGAWRRAAALSGPSASSATSTSGTSIAPPYTIFPPGSGGSRPRAHYFRSAHRSCVERTDSRRSARVAGVVVARRLGRTETSDARFPGSSVRGAPLEENARGAGGENCSGAPPAAPRRAGTTTARLPRSHRCPLIIMIDHSHCRSSSHYYALGLP